MCFLQPFVATACGDIVTLLARKQHTAHAVAAANLGAADSYKVTKGPVLSPCLRGKPEP